MSQAAPPSPTKKLNQRDMDSSCYRLSRVSKKFSVAKKETQESFAVTYYQSNPIDIRTPQEKLDEIISKLAEKVDEDAKFELLVQQKALSIMVHGEESPEAIRAVTALGSFYNQRKKPDSAYRHLIKAQHAASQTELEEVDKFNLAVELADCCMNVTTEKKQEKAKNMTKVDQLLTPYEETMTENLLNCWRRDLYLARIRAYKSKLAESLTFYERALNGYEDAHSDEEVEETEKELEEARLCEEAGQVAEKAGNEEKYKEYYHKAISLFKKSGLLDEAQPLIEKVGDLDEAEEEPHKEGGSEPTNAEPTEPSDDFSDHEEPELKLNPVQLSMKDEKQEVNQSEPQDEPPTETEVESGNRTETESQNEGQQGETTEKAEHPEEEVLETSELD